MPLSCIFRNLFSVEVKEQVVPFIDGNEFQVTVVPSAPDQTHQIFPKAKIVVNLTPEYVKEPFDEVITVHCDPPAD